MQLSLPLTVPDRSASDPQFTRADDRRAWRGGDQFLNAIISQIADELNEGKFDTVAREGVTWYQPPTVLPLGLR